MYLRKVRPIMLIPAQQFKFSATQSSCLTISMSVQQTKARMCFSHMVQKHTQVFIVLISIISYQFLLASSDSCTAMLKAFVSKHAGNKKCSLQYNIKAIQGVNTIVMTIAIRLASIIRTILAFLRHLQPREAMSYILWTKMKLSLNMQQNCRFPILEWVNFVS